MFSLEANVIRAEGRSGSHLLNEMAIHGSRVLGLGVLLNRVRRPERVEESYLVWGVVQRLRHNLRDDTVNPGCIVTEPRVCYQIAMGEGKTKISASQATL